MRTGGAGELLPLRGFYRDRRHEMGRRTNWRSHDGLFVISALEHATLPGTEDEVGPQWLISVSRTPQRARPEDVPRVAQAFGMPAWEIDNHHPGIAFHLWCPVEERYRTECECKLDEVTMVDADGYTWTTPVEGGCRGCELAAILRVSGHGRPCPIHPELWP